MLTLREVENAIAELEDVRNPNASTCAKLANLYIVREHLGGESPDYSRVAYSQASAPISAPAVSAKLEVSGNSDFVKTITGKDSEAVWKVINELMDNLKIVNPNFYESVMGKIRAIR